MVFERFLIFLGENWVIFTKNPPTKSTYVIKETHKYIKALRVCAVVKLVD